MLRNSWDGIRLVHSVNQSSSITCTWRSFDRTERLEALFPAPVSGTKAPTRCRWELELHVPPLRKFAKIVAQMTANPQLLEEWGDRLRAAGALDEAAVAYGKLLALEPTHLKASRIISSITGRTSSLQSVPGGLKPAPFVMIRGYLDPALRDELHAALVSKSGGFMTAETTKGIHLDYRRSTMLPDCFRHVAPKLEHAFYSRFLTHWQDARTRLRIEEFEPSLSETHALFYGDGDFFAPHQDTGPENTRRVTFVYNLHLTPRTFDGGDLLLYDTHFRPGRESHETEEPYFAEAHTRIIPEDNRLVLFPSEFYHEVTPVSYRGTDPGGKRLSITGWVHGTREVGDPGRIASTPY